MDKVRSATPEKEIAGCLDHALLTPETRAKSEAFGRLMRGEKVSGVAKIRLGKEKRVTGDAGKPPRLTREEFALADSYMRHYLTLSRPVRFLARLRYAVYWLRRGESFSTVASGLRSIRSAARKVERAGYFPEYPPDADETEARIVEGYERLAVEYHKHPVPPNADSGGLPGERIHYDA